MEMTELNQLAPQTKKNKNKTHSELYNNIMYTQTPVKKNEFK